MLSVHGLEVTYPGGVAALRRTTLSFREGEFTVLLGPSGAGKSTLLRSLNGLVRPTSGTVCAEGIGELSNDARRLQQLRRETGMVFQQHQLIGRLSALSNVLTGRLGHHSMLRTLLPLPRADRIVALECLERVELLDRALARVDHLSGGQQQRVGIARAIAQRPRAVLADEPVASLDPATAARVLELLHGICKADGLTAIVSLHQVDLARTFADRVVGLSGGRVVFDGAPDELNEPVLERIYERAATDLRPVPAAIPAGVLVSTQAA